MYFADMFCFGYDPARVGVTGIVGCMGIFVATDDLLYSIHVTAGSTTEEAVGAKKFGQFVNRCEAPGKVARASVYCVLNGGARFNIRKDLEPFVAGLGVKKITVVRFFKNLAPVSEAIGKGSRWDQMKSVAATFSRGNNPGQFVIKYKQESEVHWKAGAPEGGKFRDGWYLRAHYKEVRSVDPNFPGWHTADNTNSGFQNFNF
jgi:hypothetical protein